MSTYCWGEVTVMDTTMTVLIKSIKKFKYVIDWTFKTVGWPIRAEHLVSLKVLGKENFLLFQPLANSLIYFGSAIWNIQVLK